MIRICLLKVVGQKGTISSATEPEESEPPDSSTLFIPKMLVMNESGSCKPNHQLMKFL